MVDVCVAFVVLGNSSSTYTLNKRTCFVIYIDSPYRIIRKKLDKVIINKYF